MRQRIAGLYVVGYLWVFLVVAMFLVDLIVEGANGGSAAVSEILGDGAYLLEYAFALALGVAAVILARKLSGKSANVKDW